MILSSYGHRVHAPAKQMKSRGEEISHELDDGTGLLSALNRFLDPRSGSFPTAMGVVSSEREGARRARVRQSKAKQSETSMLGNTSMDWQISFLPSHPPSTLNPPATRVPPSIPHEKVFRNGYGNGKATNLKN